MPTVHGTPGPQPGAAGVGSRRREEHDGVQHRLQGRTRLLREDLRLGGLPRPRRHHAVRPPVPRRPRRHRRARRLLDGPDVGGERHRLAPAVPHAGDAVRALPAHVAGRTHLLRVRHGPAQVEPRLPGHDPQL